MNARQAQLRMVQIELHEQDWSGEQFLAWLLGLDDPDEVGRVVDEEVRRSLTLTDEHYAQFLSDRVAVLNPRVPASVGFIQGATFAAAALGREPFSSQ
jgi:hypothetical protein